MALFGNVAITTGGINSEPIVLSKETVESYEVIDETSQKSASSSCLSREPSKKTTRSRCSSKLRATSKCWKASSPTYARR